MYTRECPFQAQPRELRAALCSQTKARSCGPWCQLHNGDLNDCRLVVGDQKREKKRGK